MVRPIFCNMEAERVRNGQTCEDVAVYLGITRRTYLNWMQGKSEIPCSALVKLARLWHTTTDYLLGLTDYPHEVLARRVEEETSS